MTEVKDRPLTVLCSGEAAFQGVGITTERVLCSGEAAFQGVSVTTERAAAGPCGSAGIHLALPGCSLRDLAQAQGSSMSGQQSSTQMRSYALMELGDEQQRRPEQHNERRAPADNTEQPC